MNVQNVNTEEFLASDDFNHTVAYLKELAAARSAKLAAAYPEYTINPRCVIDDSQWVYMRKRNAPFFPVPVESILDLNNNGWMNVVEYTYQLNVFIKTIFIRKRWFESNIETKRDEFLYYVWEHYSTHQQNNEFDQLAVIEQQVFDRCSNFLEYHQQFIQNEQYTFATVDDIRALFDALVGSLILSKDGDLYQVYENIPLSEADTDAKKRYECGKLNHMDKLHVDAAYKVKTMPVLKSLNTKFNFAPLDSSSRFEGIWLEHKLNGRVWFIPQFLVFYSH